MGHLSISENTKWVTYQNGKNGVFGLLGYFGEKFSIGAFSAAEMSKTCHFCSKVDHFSKLLMPSAPKSGSVIDFCHPPFGRSSLPNQALIYVYASIHLFIYLFTSIYEMHKLSIISSIREKLGAISKLIKDHSSISNSIYVIGHPHNSWLPTNTTSSPVFFQVW